MTLLDYGKQYKVYKEILKVNVVYLIKLPVVILHLKKI